MRHVALILCCLAFATTACSAESSADGVGSSDDTLAAYRVEVSTSGPVTAGTTVELGIRVLGAGGRPVTEFDDLHTQTMHVVGVSTDLRDFFHVHPALDPNGTLKVGAPIGRAQPYKLFFEYDPAGAAGEQTSRAELEPVGGTTAVAPALSSEPNVFDGSAGRTATTDATSIELQPAAHGMLMSGMTTTLRVAVKTAAGAPATDLVDWLGMPGHAIVLSEDTSTFIHAHGMRPGAMGSSGGHSGHEGHGGGTGGSSQTSNVLDIDVNLPTAGFYKMFVQVKRADTVVTVPFVLHATSM